MRHPLDGPFAGWLVSGRAWESFDGEGRVEQGAAGALQEQAERGGEKEARDETTSGATT